MIAQQKRAEPGELIAAHSPLVQFEQRPHRSNVAQVLADAVLQDQGMALGARHELLFGETIFPPRYHRKSDERQDQPEDHDGGPRRRLQPLRLVATVLR
jgi:hypothetical protein